MRSGCTPFLPFLAIFLLVVVQLACGERAEEWQLRGWTPTPNSVPPTQTPFVVEITTTPIPTYTQVVIVVTETPHPVESLCVSATVAVHLRASPSEENYPIQVLLNGTILEDLGGRDGKWFFVQYGDLRGWVFGDYVSSCNKIQ